MSTALIKAKELLSAGRYTCVLVGDREVFISELKGVAPMLSFLAEGKNLKGFSAADKIVGRAAAFLFVYAGVSEVYAATVSSGGLKVLQQYNLPCEYSEVCDYIINRDGTGLCPMEQAVENAKSPQQALEAIRTKLLELKSKK